MENSRTTLAVAIDLEDAYSRVQFKLLMGLLVQYGVSLTVTHWIVAALKENQWSCSMGSGAILLVG